VNSSVRIYAERRELPRELVHRLSWEFRPLPVRELIMQYLMSGHPWNERRIVMLITREWRRFKAERPSP